MIGIVGTPFVNPTIKVNMKDLSDTFEGKQIHGDENWRLWELENSKNKLTFGLNIYMDDGLRKGNRDRRYEPYKFYGWSEMVAFKYCVTTQETGRFTPYPKIREGRGQKALPQIPIKNAVHEDESGTSFALCRTHSFVENSE